MKKPVLLVTLINQEQDVRETCHGCGGESSVSQLSFFEPSGGSVVTCYTAKCKENKNSGCIVSYKMFLLEYKNKHCISLLC